jgi:6-pyruvoyltetrahydropterin/6-carboxytetrahydropterin synthase
MNSVTKEIEIQAAHRVPGTLSKCRFLHGHRYVIQATCSGQIAKDGEQEGMVLDFSFLKEIMVQYIHEPCDHGTILFKEDPLLHTLVAEGGVQGGHVFSDAVIFSNDFGNFYGVPFTPTAENLARHWYEIMLQPIQVASRGHAYLIKVRVWETGTCYADYFVP